MLLLDHTVFVVLFSLLLPQFLSQTLVAIDDDSWQEQLIRVILEQILRFTGDGDEQVCLGVWWLQGGEVQGGGWCGRNLELIQVAAEMCVRTGLWGKNKPVFLRPENQEVERTTNWWSHWHDKNVKVSYICLVC